MGLGLRLLLGLLLLLLLLAHALQLLVDLLRGFDSVGRLGLRGAGGSGWCCSGWVHGWGDGIDLRGWRGFRGRVGLCGEISLLFGSVVEGGGAGIRWSGAAITRREDEFGEGGVVALDEDDVGGGAVEQRGQDLGWVSGAVVAEDSLIRDTAGYLHAGVGGDLAENLIETGVVGGDEEAAVGIGNLSAIGRDLRRSERSLR